MCWRPGSADFSHLSFADDGGQIFGVVRGKVVDRDNNHGEIQFHTSAGTLTKRLTIDINGKVQDVKGEGVVGEQPYINPGDQYQYTSGTVIETSLGTMKGSYQMIDDADNYFEAEIPEFVLSVPRVIH